MISGQGKIRVNCISAGTGTNLAARGIAGFSSMLKHYQERAPLRRSCEPSELAKPASSSQRRGRRHHGSGDLCGWWIPDHGDVIAGRDELPNLNCEWTRRM